MNKFELARDVLRKDMARRGIDRPRILDVGCRNCTLRQYVAGFADYEGLDLYQNSAGTVDHVMDVSQGLPFEDRSYHYVIALDLIEHLDDISGGLTDLLRVAGTGLLVMLPNVAHLAFRIRFLGSGLLSGKYDLVYGQGQDRHRWVTVQSQSDQYMREFARAHGQTIETIWFTDNKKKTLFANLCRAFGISPSVWVWASLYVLAASDAITRPTQSHIHVPTVVGS